MYNKRKMAFTCSTQKDKQICHQSRISNNLLSEIRLSCCSRAILKILKQKLEMAMMDDRNFLLMHIRNSFITSDDTGMCEVVIENFDHGIDRTLSFSERPPVSVR